MCSVSDSALQIFLTIYHGTLIGTFFYDYIIRNTIHLALYGLKWTYLSNIIIGVLFIAIIIWAILSVWSKIRKNLMICLVVLIVMLAVRLGVGIPDMMNRDSGTNQYKEDLAVFITQLVVHLLGVIATWMLANNSS